MRIALFGDSVFAGHGLPPDAVPAVLLGERLRGSAVTVQGAGVADETAADGLARVGNIVGDLIFVEFGLNDAIRGVPPADTETALGTVIDHLQRRGTAVVVVETRVPATSRWPALSDHTGLAERVARAHGTGFCPDILAYRHRHPQAVQDDGLHPDRTGAGLIAERLAALVAAGRC